jgi:branched-subunit amino acid ABC-type transport system permease component
VALSQIDNVSPNLGQSYVIDSFMVAVFGGVGICRERSSPP